MPTTPKDVNEKLGVMKTVVGAMKPMVILPVGAMKPADIKRLNDNGLCVVEAKNPAAVRFLDPLPIVSSRTAIEHAAIQLSRKVLSNGFWNSGETKQRMAATFVDILIAGTPLDVRPTQAEREKTAYDEERIREMGRIAREDARAEKAALKAAKETAVEASDGKEKP